MTWPRLWRLWQEPRADSYWSADQGTTVWVWYATGEAPRCVVVSARRAGATRWLPEVRVSLWAWRLSWVWMRGVSQ